LISTLVLDNLKSIHRSQLIECSVGKSIEEVGTIILEMGGQWSPAEAADPSKLFTIHLHQIQGVGIGAAAALDDWMHKTREFLGAEMVLDRI
jgi:hypothetical protein